MDKNKKLLLLGSVVSPCPPTLQGGTERVAYSQAKQLAKRGIKIIFVGAKGTMTNFKRQLVLEDEKLDLLSNIEFVEIGGGTGFGNQKDAVKIDFSQMEASRKLRMEMVNLAKVQQLIIKRQDEFNIILNNMRGEAIFFPLSKLLNKKLINVLHLNLFPQLAEIARYYQIGFISISDSQKEEYKNLNFLATIHNPVNTKIFKFNEKPENYALMIATIGYHKNQYDAILACKKAGIKLVLAGKIRDKDYFDEKIKPFIDGKNVEYFGALSFEEKLKLYQKAKVFLFPIKWKEPFGLVLIEALSCGTPVIAYPHGGPKEIIKDGKTGFLVNSPEKMAKKILEIEKIDRKTCRKDAQERFDEEVIGEKYFQVFSKLL